MTSRRRENMAEVFKFFTEHIWMLTRANDMRIGLHQYEFDSSGRKMVDKEMK